jgi:hypothetical protein
MHPKVKHISKCFLLLARNKSDFLARVHLQFTPGHPVSHKTDGIPRPNVVRFTLMFTLAPRKAIQLKA